MWTVYKKEIRSFLSSLIAYIVMGVFLLATGLFMWVLEGSTVFDLGLASMLVMFQLAPYILIFLVPAITMRSFSDEKKYGTLELLVTKPVSELNIILGKYLASLSLVIIAIVPTLIYYYSIYQLGAPAGNIDTGAMWGSYFGLVLLAACYTSVGLFCSSLTENQIVALISSMALCFLFYQVLGLFGEIQWLNAVGKSLGWFGLDYHYYSVSRGVIDTRDVLYFLGFSAFFVVSTKLVFQSRKW
ncbi:gliding motility-associated ABC transporter permease subunit GldF [Bacteroidia bacterium]|nr:gliding motility-associated ABC transporter permease subunit GldF [Bacteroidia bacterium]